MELLRLLAMFLIMLLHANNTVLNYLTPETVTGNPWYSLPILGVESLSNIGVDVFVLISGWFGIRAKLRGGLNVLFQPIFYSVLFIIFCLVAGIGTPLHPKSLASALLFTKYYWYIKAYIGLYILSPVLNAFIDKASKRQFLTVLILFFTLQTLYGCTDSSPDFYLGYSIITFCGLYLLGRYVNLYGTKTKELSVSAYLSIYISVSALLTALVFLSYKVDPSQFMMRSLYSYCNPLVIVQSLSVLLLFNKLSFTSKLVNMSAVSCLSVYLIHENINIQLFYRNTANAIYTGSSFAISFAALVVFISVVFVASILLDQLRLLIWRRLEKRIPDITFDSLS